MFAIIWEDAKLITAWLKIRFLRTLTAFDEEIQFQSQKLTRLLAINIVTTKRNHGMTKKLIYGNINKCIS